ncbi:MAG: antitoxin [archaeon]
MIEARVELDEYVNKVLNIVKAKYDLKDKSQAINTFIKIYGEHELEPQVKETYIKEFDQKVEAYLKKNPKLNAMSKKDFDKIFE